MLMHHSWMLIVCCLLCQIYDSWALLLSKQPTFAINRLKQHSLYDQPIDNHDLKTSDIFSLDSIRSTLVRQGKNTSFNTLFYPFSISFDLVFFVLLEETIIFALIERAQYRRNYDIYDPKKNKLRNVYGTPLNFLEWMLIETEKLHAKVRRYTSPEEHPFFENFLPNPVLPELDFPQLIEVKKSDINVNTEIMRWYVEKIIDRLCIPGDDEQHGSSVLCDINALQAISRRIHLGKFVAESKFKSNPSLYKELVTNGDAKGIIDHLTNTEVERDVLRRAFVKAAHYGQDINGKQLISSKIDPMLIVDIYRDLIIPLTKDVEVRYIFHRQGIKPPPPDTYYQLCRGPMDAFEDLEQLKKHYAHDITTLLDKSNYQKKANELIK